MYIINVIDKSRCSVNKRHCVHSFIKHMQLYELGYAVSVNHIQVPISNTPRYVVELIDLIP